MAAPRRSQQDDQSRIPRRRSRRRWVLLVAAASILLACTSLGVGAWWSTPQPTDMLALVQGRLATQGGHAVPLREIAPVMLDAVVAAEDERFYRHHGIDSVGLARAVIFDISHGSFQQGASTITEQLAKILYLGGDDRSPWRKVQDAALAVKIERSYSKPQILDAYLNAVYFGEGSIGIAAASERLFARAPSALSLDQASLLAGLIQAPTAYDPVTDPAAARSRQSEVLVSMIRNGFITSDQAGAVLRSSLPIGGTRSLAPDPQADVALPPLLSVRLLGIGLSFLVASAICLVASRRRAGLWIKPLGIGLLVVGLLVVGRSLQAA